MAEKDVKRFTSRMRRWELGWVDLYLEWKTGKNIQQDVNDWLNEFEFEWKEGMRDVDLGFAKDAFKNVRKEARLKATEQQFATAHGGSVASANAGDVIIARAERNMLALTLNKNLVQMFKDFDKIVEDGSGIPLATKVKQFMQQPTFKNTVSMRDKAGRKWRTGPYATMYARTKGSEIYNKTTLDDMIDVGLDVGQISPIPTDTPICSQYVGKYYALTREAAGRTGLPLLEVYPAFHPNCVHSLLTSRPLSNSQMRKNNKQWDKKTSDVLGGMTQGQENSLSKQMDYLRSNHSNLHIGAEAV
jgi:hypothetical protein